MVEKIDTTKKCTKVSENCIIGSGEEAYAASVPFENACSSIHNYLLPTV